MDVETAKAWFTRLTPVDKVVVLARTMWEMTLIVRWIFSTPYDDGTRARLAYAMSEFDHRLSSAAVSLLQDQNTYPDDVLVEMFYLPPSEPELAPYFPFVLLQAAKYFDNSRRAGRAGARDGTSGRQ
jgi:hypothetical protein